MAFFSSSLAAGEVALELELSLVSYDFTLNPLPSPRELVLFAEPIAGKLFIFLIYKSFGLAL